MGTSFYGRGGIIIDPIESAFVSDTADIEIFKNVVVSKTQPINQAVGGIWFVVEGDEDNG